MLRDWAPSVNDTQIVLIHVSESLLFFEKCFGLTILNTTCVSNFSFMYAFIKSCLLGHFWSRNLLWHVVFLLKNIRIFTITFTKTPCKRDKHSILISHSKISSGNYSWWASQHKHLDCLNVCVCTTITFATPLTIYIIFYYSYIVDVDWNWTLLVVLNQRLEVSNLQSGSNRTK
jgi:hypothetical protein